MVDCNARDILSTATIDEVHGWYSRAADRLDADARRYGAPGSFAGSNLRRFLNPTDESRRSSTANRMTLQIPSYVISHPTVEAAVDYHRRVYLSQEAARLSGGSSRILGAVRRLRDPAGTGWFVGTPMQMHYESLVEFPTLTPPSLFVSDEGRAQHFDTRNAIGSCQLRTEVQVVVDSSRRRGTFLLFLCYLWDNYDFAAGRHLDLPNPDHGRSTGLCPHLEEITAYHSNLDRLRSAGRAHDFYWISQAWVPRRILGSTDVIGRRSSMW